MRQRAVVGKKIKRLLFAPFHTSGDRHTRTLEGIELSDGSVIRLQVMEQFDAAYYGIDVIYPGREEAAPSAKDGVR